MPRLSQETLAILGASIALATLILTSTAGIRAEIHAVRVEARADRETFERHIIRLTEQQAVLSGRVDGIRDQLATNR